MDDLCAVFAPNGKDERRRGVPARNQRFEGMAQVTGIPKFLSAVLNELGRSFPGETDVRKDRGPAGYHYTVAVLSPRFSRMGWTERHRAVWDIARNLLTDDQLLKVSIVPLRPGDGNGRG